LLRRANRLWRIASATGTAATGVLNTLRTRFHRQA